MSRQRVAVAAAFVVAAALLVGGVLVIRGLDGSEQPVAPATAPNAPEQQQQQPGRPLTAQQEASAVPMPKGGVPAGPDPAPNDPAAPSAEPAGR